MALKIKSYKFTGGIANNTEELIDILAGMSGKSRRIVKMAGDIDSDIYLRLWRDGDQFVNLECDIPTTSAPTVEVNCPLAEGQLAKAGFANVSAGTVTPTVAIWYEETD